MMRLLYNTAGMLPLSNKTGGAIERLVGDQIDKYKYKYDIFLIGEVQQNTGKITVIPYKKFDEHFGSLILNNIKIILKASNLDADLIISNHHRNFLSSLFYSKFKRIPLITWEYDHTLWVPGPNTPLRILNHKLIKYSNIIITESNTQKKRMVSYGIPEEKIRVIYLGIDIIKFHPVLEKSNGYILYVAKFAPYKGQLDLLKAFKVVKDRVAEDLKLILVGPRTIGYTSKKESGYYLKCKEFIYENNLSADVILKEDIMEDELIRLYQNAMVFVHTSSMEAFGLVLLEAMSCGLPCIVNQVEPLTEVIGDSGISLDTSNPMLLANTIEKLIHDSELRKEMGLRARLRAERVFSWDIIYDQIDSLMREFDNGGVKE